MAIGANGTTAVMWATEHAIETDRVSNGQLLGKQEIQVPDGHVPNSAEVLPRPAGGFLSSWELRAGAPYLESEFDLVGVDTDAAPQNGPFSAPEFTPWPIANLLGYNGASEATLVSNERGDQLLLWDEEAKEVDNVYVASRRAGKSFSSPQRIGESAFGSFDVTVVMSATGRITIMWNPSIRSKLLVSGGYAGSRLSAPSPLSPASSGVAESKPRLLVTPRGRVIAVWTVQRGKYESPAASRSASVEAATSDNGITFGAPRRISIGGRYIHGCEGPDLLALDHAGGALAGWSCTFHRNETINEYARYRP
jgi:hypothetical protein